MKHSRTLVSTILIVSLSFLSSSSSHLHVTIVYLIHWPVPLNPKGNNNFIPTKPDGSRDILEDWNLVDTWKQLEALQKKGKVRAIGVSNFSQAMLEKILPTAEIVPAVNQVRFQYELAASLALIRLFSLNSTSITLSTS